MDVVRFAFGDRPEIDDLYARDLLESLGDRPTARNIAAKRLAGKIDAELQKAQEERSDIRLTERQLEQLIKVLAEDLPKLPQDRPKLTRLLDEARAAHARGEWAQDDS